MNGINFSENLRRYREIKGFTKAELARRIGVSDVTLGQWESGKISPRMGKIEKVAEVLEVSVDDLVFSEPTQHNLPSKQNNIRPLYGAIAAGKPLEMTTVEETIEIPQMLANMFPNAFLLKVKGDSMNKLIPDGAYALIDPCEEATNGDIYAVAINGCDATLKRFFKLSNSIALEPESYSLDHQTITFRCDIDNEMKIIGKLVWYMAPYNIKF